MPSMSIGFLVFFQKTFSNVVFHAYINVSEIILFINNKSAFHMIKQEKARKDEQVQII